jgi:hypothetical protein
VLGAYGPNGCILDCKERGYAYAGIQVGNECWCSTSYGDYGTATNCDIDCSYGSTMVGSGSTFECGGSWANSIYSTSVVPTEAPSEAPTEVPSEVPTKVPTDSPSSSVIPSSSPTGYYLGCWADNAESRDLSIFLWLVDSNLVDCTERCGAIGYAYAAMQWGVSVCLLCRSYYAVVAFHSRCSRSVVRKHAFVEILMGVSVHRPHAQRLVPMDLNVAGA